MIHSTPSGATWIECGPRCAFVFGGEGVLRPPKTPPRGRSVSGSAKTSISTANVPAYVVDQRVPGEFLPSGDDTATYRNLLGEIEMALHEHEVNLRRVEQGQQAVNSLWLWGGGVAPEQQTRALPPL